MSEQREKPAEVGAAQKRGVIVPPSVLCPAGAQSCNAVTGFAAQVREQAGS